MTPLEEKVARAMCIAAGHEPDDPTHDIYIPGDPDAIFPWAGYRGQARAAIRVVVEECAKIAESEEVPDGSNAPPEFALASPVEAAIGGVLATKEAIARRVRALAPGTPTGGRHG